LWFTESSSPEITFRRISNLFNDDTQDPGIAGVDIYKMNADGKAIEHWDVLQEISDPKKAAHANGMS
jgi:predicted SnoaL-like aldol condensation-catalyzing enzyme